MFSNQRRGSAGLGGIVGVALVVLGFLGSTGLLVKTYRDGGVNRTPAGCEVVCRQAAGTVKG
jgi:hypothetical protein